MIGKEVSIEELRRLLDRPRKARNPRYRPKRWYEFWVFEEPEFIERNEEFHEELKRFIGVYDLGGCRLHEYSSDQESWNSLGGESGYLLMKDDKVVAKLMTMQS